MADGLSIITGVSMVVFLLFYLAFNLTSKSKIFLIIKTFLILFGLFLLAYIPATTIILDRDCGILNNGSYLCYSSNGTQISTFGNGTSMIGSGFSVAYLNFLYVIFAFVIIGGLIFGLKIFGDWFKGRKRLK